MRNLHLLLLLVVLLLAAPVIAQEEEEGLVCTDEDIVATIEASRALLDEAQAALDEGDLEGALVLLTDLRASITDSEIACKGLAFEGNAGGIAGPVDLPAGLYRVTFTTGAMGALVESAVLSGDCDEYFMLMSMDSGGESVEALFDSDGCRAAFEVTLPLAGSWTLTLEPLE